MTAFWTGLVVGTVFGVFLGITAVMFFMGSRDRMTAEEWICLREFRRVCACSGNRPGSSLRLATPHRSAPQLTLA